MAVGQAITEAMRDQRHSDIHRMARRFDRDSDTLLAWWWWGRPIHRGTYGIPGQRQ